jgi:hypothetical protein
MIRVGFLRVIITLMAVRTILILFGAGRTLRWIESRGHRAALHPLESLTELDRVARTTALAAGLLPGRMECLEQSLALWYLLRRRGADVELKFGMRQFPFAAHAWVTYHGEPLNESPEALAHYVAFT